ncbi:MAG TPA: hypothetical protein VH643_23455 [Gemmataceae bacterium]|jgi:hypothetical protein
MTRLILTLVAWISLVPVVSASLTPRKERRPFGEVVRPILSPKLSVEGPEQAVGRETDPEFLVTDRTEILLDGKPCKYEEVPGHARIVKMEVAADKKTVRKIHFRTRR